MRRALLLLLLVGAVLAAMPAMASASLHGNPFLAPQWVDLEFNKALDSPAYERLEQRGGRAQLRLLHPIVYEPHARFWPLRQGEDDIRQYLDGVEERSRPGTTPILATENLPTLGCARNPVPWGAQAFRQWVDSWARGIGSHRVIVIAEVDGLGTSRCLRGRALARRVGLICHMVDALTRLPRASVYIDAGASDWADEGYEASSRHSMETMARLLRRAGIRKARGFALNATHFDWTKNNVLYGRKLSRMVGGKPFVVNTSRNGLGPLKGTRRPGNVWCNPRGRALGPLPTARPARGVDAFFWAGTPGTSNGRCGIDRGSLIGPAEVGQFWLPYALSYARNARRSRDYPRYGRG